MSINPLSVTSPVTGRVTHRITTVTPGRNRRGFGQFLWLRETTVRGISLTHPLSQPTTKGGTDERISHRTG